MKVAVCGKREAVEQKQPEGELNARLPERDKHFSSQSPTSPRIFKAPDCFLNTRLGILTMVKLVFEEIEGTNCLHSRRQTSIVTVCCASSSMRKSKMLQEGINA